MYITNPHPALARLAANTDQSKVDFLAWFNDGWVIDDRHLLANPAHPELLQIKLLPEATTQGLITPGMGILHSQAGVRTASNEQVWSFMSRSFTSRQDVKNEPHVVGPEMLTGRALQAMPFNVRADSSSAANAYTIVPTTYGAITLELQDLGSAKLNNTPMTQPQLSTVVGIFTAVCATYGVWCTPVPPDQPGRPTPIREWKGLSYHAAVRAWSRDQHSCPGAARIAQMPWVCHEVATRLAHIYGAWGVNCPS